MKWPAMLLTASVLAIGLTACGSSSSTSTGSSGSTSQGSTSASSSAKPSKKIVVGYDAPTIQPGQQAIIDGMKAAGKELGWKVTALNAQLKPDKQVSDVQTFVTQGVDAIALSALDPNALQGAYQQAQQKNVLMVGLESGGPGINTDVHWEQFQCYPHGSEEKSVEYVKSRIPHAKVLVIGSPVFPGIVVRTKCFVQKAKAAGLDVVATKLNPNDTADAAQPIVAGVLQQHPDIDAVLSYNDSSALGASAALTAAKKPIWSGSNHKGTIVIGANADQAAIDAIKQGRMTGTWDPQYKQMGYEVINVLRPVLQDGKPASSMPKDVAVNATFWDSSNVSKFAPPSARPASFDNLPLMDPKTGAPIK